MSLPRLTHATHIADRLNELAAIVKTRSRANLTDGNHILETIAARFFNALFGWDLVNLNLRQANHPVVDLGDRKRRLAVQVTNENDSGKIKDSVLNAAKHKTDADFDRLIVFFLLPKKPGLPKSFILPPNGLKMETWDIEDLLRQMQGVDDLESLARASRVLDEELGKITTPPWGGKGTMSLMISIVVIGIILLFGTLALKLAKASAKVFAVSSLSGWSDTNAEHFLLWNNGGTLSPIDVQMIVRIINLKDFPLMIRQFQFESKTTDGNWAIMPIIDPRYGKLVIRGGDYYGEFDPSQYGFPNFFPIALINKSLESRVPVTAWLLLEKTNRGPVETIRMRIRAADGKEYIEPVEMMDQTNRLQTLAESVDLPGIGYRPAAESLRNLPILPHSEAKRRWGIP